MSARTTKRLHFERLEDRLTPSLTPVGGEFRVNIPGYDFQRFPAIAAQPNGNFMVAFHGWDDVLFPNTSQGITVQRYSPDGTMIGSPIAAGECSELSEPPSIAVDAAGNAVVTWTNFPLSSGSPSSKVMAQRLDASGTLLGAPFTANSVTPTGGESWGDVAFAPNGDFIVTWMNADVLRKRRFANDGTPLTPAQSILTNGHVAQSQVSFAADGTYTIAWRTDTPWPLSPSQLPTAYFQRYSTSDQPLSGVINVGAIESFFDSMTAPNGDVIVALRTGSPVSLGFWRYASSGTLIGGFNSVSTGGYPGLTFTSAGDVALAWNAKLQTFNSDNVATSPVYTVNSGYSAIRSAVAFNTHGDAMVVWDRQFADYATTGNYYDVYARNYAGDAATPSAPPAINGGTASRSSVKDVDLDFTRPVVLPANPAAAFQLTSATGTAIPVAVTMPAGANGASDFKVTFPTYPAGLPDGRYTLKMLATQVHDAAGQPLDGNGDGTPGDDLVVQFHKLTGDFDGDGFVRQSDCMAFVGAMGGTNLTFDLDGDGVVDSKDFNRFRLAFMSSLP